MYCIAKWLCGNQPQHNTTQHNTKCNVITMMIEWFLDFYSLYNTHTLSLLHLCSVVVTRFIELKSAHSAQWARVSRIDQKSTGLLYSTATVRANFFLMYLLTSFMLKRRDFTKISPSHCFSLHVWVCCVCLTFFLCFSLPGRNVHAYIGKTQEKQHQQVNRNFFSKHSFIICINV